MLIAERSGNDIIYQMISFIPILLAIFLAGVSMLLASKLVEKLSVSLLSVIQRVFGLLLGALAIEYLISGIKLTFGLV